MKKFVAFAVLALALFSTAHSVSAHAVAIACLPRMGISVSSPPAQIICQFNEPLQTSSISMTVTDATGQRVDKNDTRFYENDDHTLVVSLDSSKMSQGIYTVQWQVTNTVDFGMTSGQFQIGLNTVVPPTPTAVLPGVPMTPTPVQPVSDGASELIPRFLIAVGIVMFAAVGVLYWRMRKSAKAENSES